MCDFEADLVGQWPIVYKEAVYGAGWLGCTPQGSMGRLRSALRVITLYCVPSQWGHKMDDVTEQ